MLKLGYKASAEQFAPTKLLDFAVQAEAVGFDSAFVSDHFQPWKHIDGHAPYSLAWLGALGARTSRLVMGTSVLTPTFRYHPSIVAQAFGTLGAMFPGRVILGIGTGESLNEVPSTGAPWPEFKERFARMREAVTLIRTLWRGERISFEGDLAVRTSGSNRAWQMTSMARILSAFARERSYLLPDGSFGPNDVAAPGRSDAPPRHHPRGVICGDRNNSPMGCAVRAAGLSRACKHGDPQRGCGARGRAPGRPPARTVSQRRAARAPARHATRNHPL